MFSPVPDKRFLNIEDVVIGLDSTTEARLLAAQAMELHQYTGTNQAHNYVGMGQLQILVTC